MCNVGFLFDCYILSARCYRVLLLLAVTTPPGLMLNTTLRAPQTCAQVSIKVAGRTSRAFSGDIGINVNDAWS